MVECSFRNKLVVGSNPVAFTKNLDIAPALDRVLLDIQTTVERRFTLKLERDMIITNSQMHLTDKYSQHNLII